MKSDENDDIHTVVPARNECTETQWHKIESFNKLYARRIGYAI